MEVMLLLFFGLLFSMFPFEIWAKPQRSDWAVVIKAQTIVYADEDLDNSIGVIEYGERIEITQSATAHGKAIGTVYSGRLGHIKVEDLYFPDREPMPYKYFRQKPEFLNQHHEDYLFENSHRLFFSVGIHDWGSVAKNISSRVDGEGTNQGPYYQLFWEHRLYKAMGVGLGAGLATLSSSETKLSEYSFHLRFWVGIPLDIPGELRLLSTLGVSPYVRYQIVNESYQGRNIFVSYGGQWVYEMFQNWYLEASSLLRTSLYSGKMAKSKEDGHYYDKFRQEWRAGLSLGLKF